MFRIRGVMKEKASGLSRRQFMVGLGAAGITATSAGLVGCATSSGGGEASATGGSNVYSGTAVGARGDITVMVTLEDEAIKTVDVAYNEDAPWEICGKAITAIPQRIVDAQSVEVDTVTGATLSSMAIISAATQALESAGVLSNYQTPAYSEPDGSAVDIETDILVLGGGLSGGIAALAAKYQDFDGVSNDLSVTLVERQGFVGGSAILSCGWVMVTAPLDDNSNVALMEDSVTSEDSILWYNADFEKFPPNRELAHEVLMRSGDTLLRMQKLGLIIETTSVSGDPSDFPYLVGDTWAIQLQKEYYTPHHWPHTGYTFQNFLEGRFDTAEVDVRLDTEVVELVMGSDGAVTGAHVSGPQGDYTINAKKVIIALGGICKSPEMMEKYAPEYAGETAFCNASSRGDGIRMAVDQVDAVVMGNTTSPIQGPDSHTGFFSDLGKGFPRYEPVMLINKEGLRFVDDGTPFGSSVFDYYSASHQCCSQTDATMYAIVDNDNQAAVERIESSTMRYVKEAVSKADTLEELAEVAGFDAAGVVATIEAYNSAYDAGLDDPDFGVAHENMVPIKTGPFYSVKLQPYAYASNVGLSVSKDCQVLNSAGEIVPNLYTVGEMCWKGDYLSFLGAAMTTGRIAGEHAKASLA